MELLIAGLGLGSGLAIAGFLLREAGLSKRLSLPLWFADAGLALMGAAVTAWLLMAAAISADLEQEVGVALIAIGAVIAAVIGMILARRAASVRMAVAAQTGQWPAGRQTQVMPLSDVQVESAVHHQQPLDDLPEDQPPAVGDVLAADEAAPEPKRDWEAIWRETWGSIETPGEAETGTQAPESADNAATARLTWAGESNGEETPSQPEAPAEQSPDEATSTSSNPERASST
ncbi:MAG: hypothetical protein KF883_14990 [Thermomicrobiales bacterium]|nr:hypothetical protein [Thermomicrobiales bacterium]